MEPSLSDIASKGYADPVARLLSVGEPLDHNPASWPDDAETFELGQGHIAELIRLACDVALNERAPEIPGLWAPVHAWRALRQLRAVDAVVPLLGYCDDAEDDETASSDLPFVFGMIGPPAIPHLAEVLSRKEVRVSTAGAAISGFKEVAQRHPEHRSECVAFLTRFLERHEATDGLINGLAVRALLDLSAVEAIDAIRQAFHRNSVDISMAGDLEEVEIELGLRKRRTTPKPRYQPFPAERQARALPPRGQDRWQRPLPLRQRQEIQQMLLALAKEYPKADAVPRPLIPR